MERWNVGTLKRWNVRLIRQTVRLATVDFGFRISDFRPPSRTTEARRAQRRHRARPPAHVATTKARSHEEITKPNRPPENAKPAHPSSRAEAQRRGEKPRALHKVARFPAVERPETAVSGLRGELERSPRSPAPAACALGKRRPRRCSSSVIASESSVPTTCGEAEPPCPGHGDRCEARRRRTLAFGVRPLLTGGRRSDRLPFCRHEAGGRPIPAIPPLRLCVFAFKRVGGRAS